MYFNFFNLQSIYQVLDFFRLEPLEPYNINIPIPFFFDVISSSLGFLLPSTYSSGISSWYFNFPWWNVIFSQWRTFFQWFSSCVNLFYTSWNPFIALSYSELRPFFGVASPSLISRHWSNSSNAAWMSGNNPTSSTSSSIFALFFYFFWFFFYSCSGFLTWINLFSLRLYNLDFIESNMLISVVAILSCLRSADSSFNLVYPNVSPVKETTFNR